MKQLRVSFLLHGKSFEKFQSDNRGLMSYIGRKLLRSGLLRNLTSVMIVLPIVNVRLQFHIIRKVDGLLYAHRLPCMGIRLQS